MKNYQQITATPRIPSNHTGLLYVAISAFTFSIMSMLIKFVSTTNPNRPPLSAFSISCYRSGISYFCNAISSIFILKNPIQTIFGLNLHLTTTQRNALIGRCITGTISLISGFTALTLLPLEDASTLIFTAPLVTFAVARIFLKEDINKLDLFCGIISMLGVLFVARPQFLFSSTRSITNITNTTDTTTNTTTNTTTSFTTDSETTRTLGVIVALTAAIASGTAYVFVRKLGDVKSEHVVGLFMATAFILSGIAALITKTMSLPHDTIQFFCILGIGVSGFLGQQFLTRGLALEKAGPASVMRYLDVIFAFIWSSLFFGNVINPYSIVGAIIISSAASTIAINKMRKQKQKEVAKKVDDGLEDINGSNVIAGDVELLATSNDDGE